MASTEYVLGEIQKRIIARFETHRAALEVEVGTFPGVDLFPSDSLIPESTTIPTYRVIACYDLLGPPLPSIEILPSDTAVEYADGQILDDGLQIDSITLRVTASGASTKTTQDVLLRYREILKRIVKEDPTFAGVFYRVRLGRANWMPMKASQEGKKFAQEMYQDLEVWTQY
jgi:hypothetical protein